MTGTVKRLLKRVRSAQPFNGIATATVRAGLGALGRRSELAIKHLPRVGVTRAILPNGRTLILESNGDDWVTNQVYWNGWEGYEPESTSLFFRLATRAQTTLDVGAHVGFYALLAAHANASGHVFAFEPMPKSFNRLTRNVALNETGNVECVASAVGATDGTADFFFSNDEIPCSSSLSAEFMSWAGESVRKLDVSVVSLDGFLRARGVGRVDLVKVDTESTEPDVLRGMAETLARDAPTILCEVLPGQGSGPLLEEIVFPLGYRAYLLTPDGPQARDRIEGHAEWLNYLFAPEGFAFPPAVNA